MHFMNVCFMNVRNMCKEVHHVLVVSALYAEGVICRLQVAGCRL